MNENTRKKAMLVQELVRKYYEPGRQDRCMLWVYRHYVNKIYPMSVATFYRYMNMKVEEDKKEDEEDKKQLKLWSEP